MNTYTLLCAASWFVLVTHGISCEEDADLSKNLTSWNRMKRDAGYFTESGTYRGGLWRHTKNTDTEVYHCLENRLNYCRHWSIDEKSPKKREYGNCTCNAAAGILHYCAQWTCETTHVDLNPDCGDCEDRYLNDTLTCACQFPASNENYCARWSCRDDSSTGYSEEEDYQCLEEDLSGEYCYQWKGNISSSYEIESSVCQCREREDRYCKHWECRERSLTRCAAHSGGWCSLEIGICAGGGIGLMLLVCSGCTLLKRNISNEEDSSARCSVCGDSLVDTECCVRYAPYFGCENTTDRLYVWRFLSCIIMLCLPWLYGVLVWGGIPALIVVLPIWFCVSLEILRLYINKVRRERVQIQHSNDHSEV